MTFPVPDLDNRSFVDLVLEAREVASRACPTWTDLSVHDPGVTLLEVFAHLTEVMLYRLNRLPEKAYLTFLNLIGLTRHPPTAAWVDLTFRRAKPGGGPTVTIPAGTAVSSGQPAAQQATFVTTEATVLRAGEDEVTVRAHHCALVEAELLGTGTGQAGQRLTVAKAPMVSTTEPIDLLLGVQIDPGSRTERTPAREHDRKTFEIWRPVHTFAGAGEDAKVYVVDRASGTITFAPAMDLRGAGDLRGPAVPQAGAEIRAWYRTGGGQGGNVGAGMLTTVDSGPRGIEVTNPQPARGGRDMEPLEAAIARGPYEFFSLQRAVTARDYEVLATAGSSGIARARAFTRVDVRPFAQPGEVEVVLVPHVPDDARPGGRLPLATLLEHQLEQALERTRAELDQRRALGTSCVTSWAGYKDVAVKGRVVVRPEEDAAAVRARIHDRLHQTISPLGTGLNPVGWGFGEPLRTSNVYRLLEQAEPGVRYVEQVRFVVGEAPDSLVRTVAADSSTEGTWYAGSGEVLFRSANDGQGWEPVGRFPGEEIRRIVPAPRSARPGMVARPGAVAMTTRRADNTGSRVYLSHDLGETWQRITELATGISDLAWIDRDPTGALLLAGDKGLYEIPLLPDSLPNQIVVDPADPDRALYAVEAFISPQGTWAVAAASQAQLGIYLSVQGGRRETFGNIGPRGNDAVDTRCLAVQLDGPSTVLWAGVGEVGPAKSGTGCLRARMFEADVRWERLSTRWTGGTCWDVAFAGRRVLAATQSAGVLAMDSGSAQPSWSAPDVNCGLPLRDRARFDAVGTVGAAPAVGDTAPTVMAGGPRGVYRSPDAARWAPTANRETTDAVTIPDTWLLCSGEHEIEVVGGYAQADD
ncbi:MAG: putative baseplate assembly protein [Haloechinothrix sp.]